MNYRGIVVVAILMAAPAAMGNSEHSVLETLKTPHAVALAPVASELPVNLTGSAQNLRCQASLRWSGSRHSRCGYDSVVTGVQVLGSVVQLTCARVEVNCS